VFVVRGFSPETGWCCFSVVLFLRLAGWAGA
jgi:hypothetical protein